MGVIGASLVGMAAQLLVGLLVWWLRLRWQVRTEQQRGQLAIRLTALLQQSGGRLREHRADGSMIDLTVTGPDDDQ